MRSPGCMMARPMNPLVEPTVRGVSRVRRSPPRLRLGSVSLRSTMRGRVLYMVRLQVGLWGVYPRAGVVHGLSGLGSPAIGDQRHVGVRQEAGGVPVARERPFYAECGAVEQAGHNGGLPPAMQAERPDRIGLGIPR